MSEFKAEDFRRRYYTVEGDTLNKARRIELVVRVDGKVLVHLQAREPGIVAFVSRPHEQGFDVEVVEVGAVRYTDVRVPTTVSELRDWQIAALGL